MTAAVVFVATVLVVAGLKPCARTVGPATAAAATTAAAAALQRQNHPPRRDLSVDESRGGHTLARHVGRTDGQLEQRLREQPNISAASTYTDRETAELVVGAILESESSRIESWTRRRGSRPNLALRTRTPRGPPVGRVLERGQKAPVEARHAVVVLRWDTATRGYYVLTSYPEAR